MKIVAHKLKDDRFENWREMHEWEYDDWRADPAARAGWISFDCLAYDPERDDMYCGVSSFDSDIFYRFRRSTGQFELIDTHVFSGSEFDAKFHRSLEWDDQGKLWAATALFHDVDRYLDAPGGKLLRFDPETDQLEHVGTPLKHVYIQAIALDLERRILYATTFTPEYLLRYDMDTGQVRKLTLLGPGFDLAQPEKFCLDSSGHVWCTWRVTRAFSYDRSGMAPFRLLRYDPEVDRITFYRHGIPPVCHGDDGKIESMVNGRDGFLYLGSAAGALYRLNPDNAEVSFIAKPACGPRLTSFAHGPDGLLYFASGRPRPHLFRFNPENDHIEDLGLIRDDDLAETCWQVHDIVVTEDGSAFCGENDVPHRSGYLWECRIDRA